MNFPKYVDIHHNNEEHFLINYPNLINITMTNTNVHEHFLSMNCEGRTCCHKQQNALNKSFCFFEKELKKEKIQNQILIKKILSLEKTIEKKDELNNFNHNDNKKHKIAKVQKTEMSADIVFLKNLEIKIEGILNENERLSAFFKTHSEQLEEKISSLEDASKEFNSRISAVLEENEKLRNLIDEMRISFEEERKKLIEEKITLEKENHVILASIAIANQQQSIEKNKMNVLLEQNNLLKNRNTLLLEELNALKGKNGW